MCLLPLVHIFAVSFSGRAPATAGFVSFWPLDFTIENYQEVMGSRTFRALIPDFSMRAYLSGASLNMVLVISNGVPALEVIAGLQGAHDLHLVLRLRHAF